MSNSASKEKARRWRDHFLPAFFGFFSDTAAPAALLFLLLAQKKNRRAAAIAATTTGTAIAAFKAGEHEMRLQEFSETVTAPSLVLLAVLEGLPVILPEAPLPEAVERVVAVEPVAATVALASPEVVD